MVIASDTIRGHIESIVLAFLLEKDNYAYEILKLISDKTKSMYEIKESSLYSAIRRLEEQKLVESYWADETLGGRRKYYKITEHGKTVFFNAQKEWIYAKNIIDKLMNTENINIYENNK